MYNLHASSIVRKSDFYFPLFALSMYVFVEEACNFQCICQGDLGAVQKGAEGLEAAEHQAGSKRAVRRAAQTCDMCKYILILQYNFILHATYSAFYFIPHVTLFCIVLCSACFFYSACSFILHVPLFCMLLYSACSFILHVTSFCMFLYSACSFILHVPLFCMFMGNGPLHYEQPEDSFTKS